jgi:hypothetical protein
VLLATRPGDWSALGLSSDPTPGDRDVVDGIVKYLGSVRDAAADAGTGLQQIVDGTGDGAFVGRTGDWLREQISGKTRDFLNQVATAFTTAQPALSTYLTAMDDAQSRADQALSKAQGMDKADPSWAGLVQAAKDAGTDLASAGTKAAGLIDTVASAHNPWAKSACEEFWEIFQWIVLAITVIAIFVGGPIGLLAFALNAVLAVKAVVDFATGKTNALGLALGLLGLLAPSTKAISLTGLLKTIGSTLKTIATKTPGAFAKLGGDAWTMIKSLSIGNVLRGISDVSNVLAGAVKTGGVFVVKGISGAGLAAKNFVVLHGFNITAMSKAIGNGIRTVGTDISRAWSASPVGKVISNEFGGWKTLRLFTPLYAPEIGVGVKGVAGAFNLGVVVRGLTVQGFKNEFKLAYNLGASVRVTDGVVRVTGVGVGPGALPPVPGLHAPIGATDLPAGTTNLPHQFGGSHVAEIHGTDLGATSFRSDSFSAISHLRTPAGDLHLGSGSIENLQFTPMSEMNVPTIGNTSVHVNPINGTSIHGTSIDVNSVGVNSAGINSVGTHSLGALPSIHGANGLGHVDGPAGIRVDGFGSSSLGSFSAGGAHLPSAGSFSAGSHAFRSMAGDLHGIGGFTGAGTHGGVHLSGDLSDAALHAHAAGKTDLSDFFSPEVRKIMDGDGITVLGRTDDTVMVNLSPPEHLLGGSLPPSTPHVPQITRADSTIGAVDARSAPPAGVGAGRGPGLHGSVSAGPGVHAVDPQVRMNQALDLLGEPSPAAPRAGAGLDGPQEPGPVGPRDGSTADLGGLGHSAQSRPVDGLSAKFGDVDRAGADIGGRRLDLAGGARPRTEPGLTGPGAGHVEPEPVPLAVESRVGPPEVLRHQEALANVGRAEKVLAELRATPGPGATPNGLKVTVAEKNLHVARAVLAKTEKDLAGLSAGARLDPPAPTGPLESKISSILGPEGSSTGDCLVRLEKLHDGLFRPGGGGVPRGVATVDDALPPTAALARKVGADWTRLGSSWKPVEDAVLTGKAGGPDGPGATALVHSAPPGQPRHAFAAMNWGGQVHWVELQNAGGFRVLDGPPTLPVGAKAIVLDHTGAAVAFDGGPLRGAGRIDGLLDPPTTHTPGMKGSDPASAALLKSSQEHFELAGEFTEIVGKLIPGARPRLAGGGALHFQGGSRAINDLDFQIDAAAAGFKDFRSPEGRKFMADLNKAVRNQVAETRAATAPAVKKFDLADPALTARATQLKAEAKGIKADIKAAQAELKGLGGSGDGARITALDDRISLGEQRLDEIDKLQKQIQQDISGIAGPSRPRPEPAPSFNPLGKEALTIGTDTWKGKEVSLSIIGDLASGPRAARTTVEVHGPSLEGSAEGKPVTLQKVDEIRNDKAKAAISRRKNLDQSIEKVGKDLFDFIEATVIMDRAHGPAVKLSDHVDLALAARADEYKASNLDVGLDLGHRSVPDWMRSRLIMTARVTRSDDLRMSYFEKLIDGIPDRPTKIEVRSRLETLARFPLRTDHQFLLEPWMKEWHASAQPPRSFGWGAWDQAPVGGPQLKGSFLDWPVTEPVPKELVDVLRGLRLQDEAAKLQVQGEVLTGIGKQLHAGGLTDVLPSPTPGPGAGRAAGDGGRAAANLHALQGELTPGKLAGLLETPGHEPLKVTLAGPKAGVHKSSVTVTVSRLDDGRGFDVHVETTSLNQVRERFGGAIPIVRARGGPAVTVGSGPLDLRGALGVDSLAGRIRPPASIGALEGRVTQILGPEGSLTGDCLVRLEKLHDGLFRPGGGGVPRGVATMDDALTPTAALAKKVGGDWERVGSSWTPVEDALRAGRAGDADTPGAVALVHATPAGQPAHAFAAMNWGGDVRWLELQNEGGFRVLDGPPSVPVGARAIVLDHTGRPVDLGGPGRTAVPLADAIVDPATTAKPGMMANRAGTSAGARPHATEEFQPYVITHPGYATGDQFSVLATLKHNPNAQVIVTTTRAGGVLDRTDRGADIHQFYKDAGIEPERVHLTPVTNIRDRTPADQAAIRTLGDRLRTQGQPPSGVPKLGARSLELGLSQATQYVAKHFDAAMSREFRTALQLDDLGSRSPALEKWLRSKGVTLTPDTKVTVVWSRFSGKKGNIHLEHDTSLQGVRQILGEFKAEAAIRPGSDHVVIIAGDRHPDRPVKVDGGGPAKSHADTYSSMAGRFSGDGLKVHDLTEFWKGGDDPLLAGWKGDTRIGQYAAYEYLKVNSGSFQHIGFRSGNLEAFAMAGHEVHYLEEVGSMGGARMAAWHDAGGGRTALGGEAPGYHRILLAEPPTRSGRYLKLSLTQSEAIFGPASDIARLNRDLPVPRQLTDLVDELAKPSPNPFAALAKIRQVREFQGGMNQVMTDLGTELGRLTDGLRALDPPPAGLDAALGRIDALEQRIDALTALEIPAPPASAAALDAGLLRQFQDRIGALHTELAGVKADVDELRPGLEVFRTGPRPDWADLAARTHKPLPIAHFPKGFGADDLNRISSVLFPDRPFYRGGESLGDPVVRQRVHGLVVGTIKKHLVEAGAGLLPPVRPGASRGSALADLNRMDANLTALDRQLSPTALADLLTGDGPSQLTVELKQAKDLATKGTVQVNVSRSPDGTELTIQVVLVDESRLRDRVGGKMRSDPVKSTVTGTLTVDLHSVFRFEPPALIGGE